MMYASHQMQVIDKALYNEMTDLYADFIDKGLCEWAMYFNYAVAKYPHRFHCLPYVSMGWPGNITDWKLEIQPGDFLFENHYSTLYEEGQVFAGLHEDFCGRTVEENQIKIFRFSRHLQKQREGQRMFEAYCASYRNQYRERCGYYGEHIVLKAQQMGLRTCWVGGTYRKVPDVCELADGEKIIAVIAIGYGNEDGVPHKSKEFSEVAICSSKCPVWFKKGVRAASAPGNGFNRFCSSSGTIRFL